MGQVYKKLDRSDRERVAASGRVGRLEVRHRAQSALRCQIRQPTLSYLSPLPAFPPSVCLSVPFTQSQIDSGKDMENYESVGVEQIELDIVES